MTRYYHPDEFAELKRFALGLGFVHVEAGPLVRSSYHAHEQADALRASRLIALQHPIPPDLPDPPDPPDLLPPRLVHVRRRAEELLRRFHHRLGQRRMRVNRQLRRRTRSHPSRSPARPSAISSPAPDPTMPTPRTRSVSGSISILVMPSTRSIAIARPDAGQGKRTTSTLRPSCSAWVSVRPAHAIFRVGEHHGRNRQRLEDRLVAGNGLDRDARFVRRFVRQHRLARDVANREYRRLLGSALKIGLDEAAIG